MEKAKIDWYESINTKPIEIQNALKHIYDNEVKLELARINNIDIDFDMMSKEKINQLLNNELSRINNKIKLSEFIYYCQGTDEYDKYFKDNMIKLQHKYEGIMCAIDEYNSV